MARVKICGIRSLADMQIAVQQGADAIGVLVGQLHPSSDFLPPELAAEIFASTPPFVTTVLVTHIEDPAAVLRSLRPSPVLRSSSTVIWKFPDSFVATYAGAQEGNWQSQCRRSERSRSSSRARSEG